MKIFDPIYFVYSDLSTVLKYFSSYNFVLFIARILIRVTGSTLLLNYDVIRDMMIISIFIFLSKIISNRIK